MSVFAPPFLPACFASLIERRFLGSSAASGCDLPPQQQKDRTEAGQIGALLRREGLYSSNLTHWRQQRDEGSLKALSPKKRGPKPDPLANENAALRRRIERLEAELKRAETIIEVQKKLSDLLGLQDPSGQKNEEPQ